MKAARRVLLTIAVALGVLATTGSISPEAGAKEVAGRFVVKGDVANKLKLTTKDLAALPQHALHVKFQAGSAVQEHDYTGPLLLDVLNLAGPEFDATIKNDNLRHFVAVTGADGYRVVVAWGEFD